MAKSGVQLLGEWSSPFSNRVQIAFNLKSIGYEFINEDILFSQKSELLLKSNPVYKKIPVLFHDGRPLCESLVILQYIDEAWADNAPSILPSDHYDRATARFWAAYIDDKLIPLFKEFKEAIDNDARRALMEKTLEILTVLEGAFVSCSNGKGFFGGDGVGYVDIVLGSYIGWFRAVEVLVGLKCFNETSTPGLVAWVERFCSDSAVKDVVPSTKKLLDTAAAVEKAKASSE